MLIKTTKDNANTHYFISFPDADDTKIDFGVTKILYKIWAINTVNLMINEADKQVYS